MSHYFRPSGGLPRQTTLLTQRAILTDAYCVIPGACLSDIVTSLLPGWEGARAWVLARPLTGFAETFSQYLMEVAPGGGSDMPEPEAGAEGWLFLAGGRARLSVDGTGHALSEGALAYLPPGCRWTFRATGDTPAHFHWLRKLWEGAPGLTPPTAFVVQEQDITPHPMPDTGGAWATTRFVDPADLRHDAHVTIVTLRPGAVIPFEETHVMEHGLFVLQGKAVYRLNRDWVEVEAGDFMWLRAFCPQACYAGGPEAFRYLLYKDVNRHARLRGPGAFGPLP